MVNPKVSIVITTFNRAEVLPNAIRSAVNQTYENLEIIIVDDNSIDNTAAEIEQFKKNDNRIIYKKQQTNRGLAASRNMGIRSSMGEYIAFLDDDDIWKPTKIEKQLYLFQNKVRDNVAVISCAAETRNQKGDKLYELWPRVRGDIRQGIINYGLETISSHYLFRKCVLVEIEGFDENLISSIDHDIWMKLAQNRYESDYFDEILVVTYSRDHSETMMNDPDRRIRGVNQFFAKWSPLLFQMYGERRLLEFEKDYYLRVAKPIIFRLIVNWRFNDIFKTIGSIRNSFNHNMVFDIRVIFIFIRAFLYNILPSSIKSMYIKKH